MELTEPSENLISTMAHPKIDPGQQMFRTVFSFVVTSVGTVANALSFSYFINISNKSLGDRILILLNTLDLSVCLLTLFDVIFELSASALIRAMLDSILFFVFTESTAFATCLLSVTRALSLCFPFYLVNKKAVQYGTALYFLYIILKEGMLLGLQFRTILEYGDDEDEVYEDVSKKVTIFTLIVFVIVVLISNSLTGYKLLFSKNETINQGPNTRRAGITVFILSSLFLFFNFLYIAVGGAMIAFNEDLNDLQPDDIRTFLLETVMQFSVPINSACNPIVYICRKAHVRAFIKSIWLRCCGLQTNPSP